MKCHWISKKCGVHDKINYNKKVLTRLGKRDQGKINLEVGKPDSVLAAICLMLSSFRLTRKDDRFSQPVRRLQQGGFPLFTLFSRKAGVSRSLCGTIWRLPAPAYTGHLCL